MTNLSNDEIVEVLTIFTPDGRDHILWNLTDDGLVVFADCSDFFDWASSDFEQITHETLPLLRQCSADLQPWGEDGQDELNWLYAARKRGIRPMPEAMVLIDERIRFLFEECGPERDIGAEGLWGSHRGESTPWVGES